MYGLKCNLPRKGRVELKEFNPNELNLKWIEDVGKN